MLFNVANSEASLSVMRHEGDCSDSGDKACRCGKLVATVTKNIENADRSIKTTAREICLSLKDSSIVLC